MQRRLSCLLLVLITLVASFCALSAMFRPVSAQPLPPVSGNVFFDLNYVASNLNSLNDTAIMTRGLVRFIGSVYMFEDFWLQDELNQSARIPVVIRFSRLPVPRNGSLIEVAGTVRFGSLEGGFFYLNATSVHEIKNVILIGWDGVQRNHLFELLNRGLLPNLQSLISDGAIANVTVSDHRTDTKSGWTQILTGYRWWKTGVFNNAYWFHSIPLGYTIAERIENSFGRNKVATAHITGKVGHMEVLDGSGTTANGTYSREAIYSNLPSQLDFCSAGDRNATIVGSLALQFLGNNSNRHFFAFIHFSDPDSAGHNTAAGGENSVLYEDAIVRCDNWTGRILNRLQTLNISQNTLVYVTADHGFDENGTSHNNAPFVALATNDKRVMRNGDQVDVAPTLFYGLGMWDGVSFEPALDGYPLQTSLPSGVGERRLNILADNTPPPKPTITSPVTGANVSGTVIVRFNASDRYLKNVLLLVNNSLQTDGPWTWQINGTVANGSFSWHTVDLAPGNYVISILAFDEHGATNGLSTSTVTVHLRTVIPEIPTAIVTIMILGFLSLVAVVTKKSLHPKLPGSSSY